MLLPGAVGTVIINSSRPKEQANERSILTSLNGDTRKGYGTLIVTHLQILNKHEMIGINMRCNFTPTQLSPSALGNIQRKCISL